jgi:hypothetical protein
MMKILKTLRKFCEKLIKFDVEKLISNDMYNIYAVKKY